MKRRKREILSSIADDQYLDHLAPPMEQSPFKKIVQRYFEDQVFKNSQKEIAKEMRHIKKALLKMDDAQVAYDMMMEARQKILNAYQDILDKSKVSPSS